MSKAKFVLNPKGVRELLTSPEMAKVINEHISRALTRLGGSADYAGDVQIHNRVVGRVYTANSAGDRENNESNTLLKALGND